MRVVLVGAVQSTEQTLKKLIELNIDVVGVFGYRAENTGHVSGYVDLEGLSRQAGISFYPFKNINHHVEQLAGLTPDVIFVVGLSQIVSERILAVPSLYCVGFHPTKLPRGRGRAPLAWMILDQASYGSASFFVLQRGVDDGAILAQCDFQVTEDDDVQSLIDKTLNAMDRALERLLHGLLEGNIEPVAQCDQDASYYGRRSPEDGVIDWSKSAEEISRLVRATADPYPGAYSFIEDRKIVLQKVTVLDGLNVTGVTGRILSVDASADCFTVQCGIAALQVDAYSVSGGWVPRVGLLLGYLAENEIFNLKRRMAELEALLLKK